LLRREPLHLGGGSLALELLGGLRWRLRAVVAGPIASIEHAGARAAAEPPLLVPDEVDEEHAESLRHLDLAEPRAPPALGARGDEALAVVDEPGLHVAMEQEPHELLGG